MDRDDLVRQIARNHFTKYGRTPTPLQLVSLDEAIEWFNCRPASGMDLPGALALAFSVMDGARRQRISGMIEELVQQRTIDGAVNLAEELAVEIRLCAMIEIRPLARLALGELGEISERFDSEPHGMRPIDFDSSTLS